MPLISLAQVRNTSLFKDFCLIASDMDGTLTQKGRFSATLLQTLEQLQATGIDVLIVTGRSAGWVSGLATYLPIAGAIAENGAVYYGRDRDEPQMLVPIADVAQHRERLATMFAQLQHHLPTLQPAADNSFRLSDWTFANEGFSEETLTTLANLCDGEGWGFTYSAVQCHIKLPAQDKASGLRQVLQQHFPHCSPAQTITVGDSPNDESLFDASHFPCSVGVANIADYAAAMTHHPTYLTTAAEGAGFCELADLVLQHH